MSARGRGYESRLEQIVLARPHANNTFWGRGLEFSLSFFDKISQRARPCSRPAVLLAVGRGQRWGPGLVDDFGQNAQSQQQTAGLERHFLVAAPI